MSYQELFTIVSQPWASIKEISKIARCGRDAAIKVRDEIEDKIIKSGKKLPKSKKIYVPMKEVLDYFELDINFIKEMALKELEVYSNIDSRTKSYANISR